MIFFRFHRNKYCLIIFLMGKDWILHAGILKVLITIKSYLFFKNLVKSGFVSTWYKIILQIA